MLVLGHLVADTDWGRVFGQRAGPTPLMITGVGLIAAGGISWAPSAPESTRCLPRTASPAAIVRNSVAGVVVLPLILMDAVISLVLGGVLMLVRPLASNNPVGGYGLGWVATVAVSFLLYAVLPKPAVAPVAQPAKGSATMAV
ncbi:cytosine permease [Streptomyces mirabilis]|uniref:cytosine permease n=1 Tax=Streptomyces mirabilis TaxID=68239 RepID=UPI00368878C1